MAKRDWIVIDPSGHEYGDPHPDKAYLKGHYGSELVLGVSGLEAWELLERDGWKVITMEECINAKSENSESH